MGKAVLFRNTERDFHDVTARKWQRDNQINSEYEEKMAADYRQLSVIENMWIVEDLADLQPSTADSTRA